MKKCTYIPAFSRIPANMAHMPKTFINNFLVKRGQLQGKILTTLATHDKHAETVPKHVFYLPASSLRLPSISTWTSHLAGITWEREGHWLRRLRIVNGEQWLRFCNMITHNGSWKSMLACNRYVALVRPTCSLVTSAPLQRQIPNA